LSYTPVLFVNSPGRMGGQKLGFFDLCVQD